MSLTTPPGSEDPQLPFFARGGLLLDEVASPEPSEALAGQRGISQSSFWQRFLRERFAVAGLLFLLLVIVVAIFAPLIAPDSPTAQNLLHVNAGPSSSHWLGTDDLGRDILSRLIWGARTSLRATGEIVGIAAVIAIPLGLIAGFFRGAIDSVTMRLMDAMFSFPPLILALTVAALLGASINDTALAIGVVFVPGFVRLIRSQVIAVREESYIEAARSLGASSNRIIRRHVLPNVASPVIIQLFLALGFALLVEAGLSYLGIGEQPPTPSWGGMLQEGFSFIYDSPWALVFPGLAIMLTVLSFNLLADGLRDALGRERPRVKRQRGERALKRAASTVAAQPRSPGEFEAPDALLKVEGLGVEFLTNGQWLPVLEDANFEVQRGKTLGLVGESGSGKTVSALAIMGLLPTRSARASGSALFDRRDLMGLSPSQLRRIRGNEIAMIFQEPMTSLNPAFTVGNQVAEQVRMHLHLSRDESWRVAIEMLDRAEIPDAKNRAKDYPHAFSGGMRQRVMIAMALSCSPKLLIADEPTTALDVTTQAQIVELLHALKREENMAMIFVTHDLGVIADVADDVVVMYAGQVVENAEASDAFVRPRHPYTEALLSSIPQLSVPGEHLHAIPGMVPRPDQYPAGCRFAPRCTYVEERCEREPVPLLSSGSTSTVPTEGRWTGVRLPVASRVALTRCVRQDELSLAGAPIDRLDGTNTTEVESSAQQTPLLEVTDLAKRFAVRTGILRRVSGHIRAVDGVDMRLATGTTLGLVGESGSGKSTLARLVLRLIDPTAGEIRFDSQDMTRLTGQRLRHSRRAMQMIFQDPYSSLNPRQSVLDIVSEPLKIHTHMNAKEREERVIKLLDQVGIGRHVLSRRPHEFSGGQRQRIAIARALAVEPKLLVCDEPVSALDVSTQSQVINLLSDLQKEFGLTYLFIAHDLSVVRHLSDRIAVMYLGKVIEEGAADDVYRRPTHPYTAALLSAIPVPDPNRQRARERIVLSGEVGSLSDGDTGCRFRSRCPFAMDICSSVDPEPYVTEAGTTVRCHLHTSGPVLAGQSVTGLRATV